MHAVATRGRWVWILSGLVVMGSVASAASAAVLRAGSIGEPGQVFVVPTRTVTIKQPVTSLSVTSYGAAIQVTGAPVRYTQVVEAVYSDAGTTPPAVTATVSRGRLTLAAPACGNSPCSVGFTVTVPEGVAVTAQGDGGQVTVSGIAAAYLDSGGAPVRATDVRGPLTVNAGGGPVTVSGVASANLDSGGGPVSAANVRGSLTVNAEGGGLMLTGLSGPLDADTGGGPLLARDVAAVTATVNTEGGDTDIDFTTPPQAVTVDTGGGTARLAFATAPRTVMVSTEGGNAILTMPGGPYALTAETEGAPETVAIATSPAASRSITADTGGGALAIASGTGPAAA